jgi:hypothetical protein
MQYITGILFQTQGTLNTKGKLTLLSDQNKTAIIDLEIEITAL